MKESIDQHLSLEDADNKLFLIFPNFEERSVASARLLSSSSNKMLKTSSVMVYWLQGDHPAEMLDHVKEENVHRVRRLLEHKVAFFRETQLSYPQWSRRKFEDAVKAHIATMVGELEIIMDISCVPRSLLSQLLEVLFPLYRKWPFKIAGVSIKGMRFYYTWAADYPRSVGPELLGDLTGYRGDRSLLQFVEGKDSVRMVLTCAGTGHDALQASSVAAHLSRASTVKMNAFMFMNHRAVARSYEHMTRNQGLIGALSRRGESFRTFFSVDQFSDILENIVNELRYEHRDGNCSLVLGPFGPKIFGVCALLAARNYLRQSIKYRYANSVDIFDLNGHQYLTTYSIGAGITDCYVVRPSELDHEQLDPDETP